MAKVRSKGFSQCILFNSMVVTSSMPNTSANLPQSSKILRAALEDFEGLRMNGRSAWLIAKDATHESRQSDLALFVVSHA